MPLYNIELAWMPWMLFAMLVLLVIISALQPQTISNSLRTILSPVQRRYTDTDTYGLNSLMIVVFEIGVISMTALTVANALLPTPTHISMAHWGCTLVLVGLFLGLNRLTDHLLQTIYRFGPNSQTYHQHKDTIWMVLALVCFAYLMSAPWLGATATVLIPLCLGIVYIGTIVWKLIMLFGISIHGLFYMLLYVVHAELLPLTLVIGGSYYILLKLF